MSEKSRASEGEFRKLVELLGGGVIRTAREIRGALRDDPYHLVTYRSFGSAERALVLARAIQDEGIAAADPALPKWRNLLNALKRIEADPLPFARVIARTEDAHHELTADDEGFVHAWIPLRAAPDPGWRTLELALPTPPRGAPAAATAHVLVPSSAARFGVISDMDDTVLQSEITNFLRAARLMLLENARTRLPFPGVAAFYRALHDAGGTANPIFYVSSSPWNLYDVIDDFLAAQEIPAGPLLLRDWDVTRTLLRNRSYKATRIREILETYPTLPFMLVGDSGQEDPEIYSEIVHDFRGRVIAVYIRNVTPVPERVAAIRTLAEEVRAVGSTLVLADDTLAVARHAAAHGWIPESALPEIAGEKRADEGKTAEKVESPGVEPATAPTVVVDDTIRASDVD